MSALIGIRREDKNEWERRVPLTPADIASLISEHGLSFRVQSSPRRVFGDAEYREAGADVREDIDAADIVLAVKEIPVALLRPGKVYVFFAHVIKGQRHNMPMLARLLDLNATLIDYERVADDSGRRLIFFSRHAGYAGMIETLWSWGQRLRQQGTETDLLAIDHAYRYPSLAAAKHELAAIGRRIAARGLGARRPRIIGIAGYGNVARGCHEILDELGVPALTPERLLADHWPAELRDEPLLRVEFREEDMVEPTTDAPFVLQDYYDHPERYRGAFARFLPHLDVLVNTIYWEPRYPRLVTLDWIRNAYGAGRRPRLQVIGDISCDIGGSIEATVAVTMPDQPSYVWDVATEAIRPGVVGDGPVIMAVDNLPCELPREASEAFSGVLRDLVPALAAVDWRAEFADLELPSSLRRAVVAHRGGLTPDYRYLREFLDA